MMKTSIVKATVALGLGAALMASVADPSFARNRWAGPAIGFGAGLAVGAAAANANAYYTYNDPYYYGGYSGPYGGAYAAAPGHAYPSYYPYYSPRRNCAAENIGRPGC